MQAKELFHMHSLDAEGYLPDERMPEEDAWQNAHNAMRMGKMRDLSRKSSAAEQMVKEGVRTPVDIVHGDIWSGRPGVNQSIGNGNHRIVAMQRYNPDAYLPVEHHVTPFTMTGSAKEDIFHPY